MKEAVFEFLKLIFTFWIAQHLGVATGRLIRKLQWSYRRWKLIKEMENESRNR